MSWDGNNRRSKEPWHLDRKVPLALVITILLQTGGAIFWAGEMSKRTEALERWRTEQQILQINDGTIQARIETRLSVLESQNVTIVKTLDKITDKLDVIYRNTNGKAR